MVAYEDDAVGVMERREKTFRFTDVLLRPRVTIAPGSDPEKARALHEKAHEDCFIANSVNFPVRNEPEIRVAATV
jgi:organic hydroperoxide reductase OsmC/OhrA